MKRSAIKIPTLHFKPIITLSILETLLHQCQNVTHFNQILSQTIISGFLKNDTFAANKLLKFSTDSPHFIHIKHSQKIFSHIKNPNGFVFNTMMRANIQRNTPHNVIPVYKRMLEKYVEPDNYTYPLLFQSCSVRLAEFDGKMIHGHVWKMGFDADVYVQNTLINLYAVCGNLVDARKVFDESPVLDLVSWNSILAGYVSIGDVEEAKWIYDRMPKKNVIASNSMIVLFGRKGNVVEACRLFNEMEKRDLVSWSALISSYEQNEMYAEALTMFNEMSADGIMVDEVLLVSVVSACAHLLVVETGKLIHGLAVKIGIESYLNLQNAFIYLYSSCGEIVAAHKLFSAGCYLDLVSWNSMVAGYLRCGEVEKAWNLFGSMPEKDTVSWGTMISGYAQYDRFDEALVLFQKMQLDGIRPDETTLVSVISACTRSAAIDQGIWVHAYIRRNSFKVNIILGTTIIDMYMKFGFVDDALEVFDRMEEKGPSTWNALILGLALNGYEEKSLEMFSEMKRSSVIPNEITFMAVLGACTHMGLVEEGRRHFSSMNQEHKIEPNVKHYGCMVDLLGRAGMLKEAEELIESMPMAPDVSTWGALLGACTTYGDIDMGERIGRKLIKRHPNHDGFKVLLSNIYASKGNWEDVLEVREAMVQQGMVKTPGCSMIEA